MWRTNKTGVDIGIGLFDIVAVLLDRMGKSLDVVVGMVPHLVPFSEYAFVEFRVLAHIVANHKERGFCIERLEDIEDKRSSLGDGTVVKGQVNCLLVTVHSPVGFRIEPAEIYGWLFDKHPFVLFLFSKGASF